ncbi:MAG: hypothetical protein IT431_09965 [Phycisphaerales bacterium]|nr:hypothetical protein [Phycisphaerales bacterium]
MPGKRATTPLFDLLQQGRRAGVETHPMDAPIPEPIPSAAPEPRGGVAEAPIRIVGGVVQMPLLYASLAMVLAFVAVIAAWTLGYGRGERQAKADQSLLESALGPDAKIVEPGTGSKELSGQPAGRTGTEQTANQSRGGTPAQGSADFLTASGPTGADPRSANHNYLQLGAQLRADQVAGAIAFLHDQGIEAFGVIDPAGGRGNDGRLYVLVAAQGIPSGQADSPEARRYRERVLAAGAAWKKAGGVKNFDDAYWKLFKP